MFFIRSIQKTLYFVGILLISISFVTQLSAEPKLMEQEPRTQVGEIIVITATKNEVKLKNVGASIGVVTQMEIEDIDASHASELLNRLVGVNILQINSSGPGVVAAIRQPISYTPVYLYLENGIPTRSAGFFNHNALYSINAAGSNGVEVLKGPGSALYGSDAIGAVINVRSGDVPKKDRLLLKHEIGENSWNKLSFNGAKVLGDQAITGSIQVSESDGWREHNEFDQQIGTTSWAMKLGQQWKINNIFSFNSIKMNTGGSGLNEEDYLTNPEQPGNLIAYRDVSSFRFASHLEKDTHNGTLSVTPYLRSNELEYLAHWTLNTGTLDSQDAHINKSGHHSIGLQLRYHQNVEAWDGYWIAGVDIDNSTGDTEQTYVTRSGDLAGDYWLALEKQHLLYDYDVDYQSVSPYIHTDFVPLDKLNVSLGLRYDSMTYNYRNKLTDVLHTQGDSIIHYRPSDTEIEMHHLSPKVSATYQITEELSTYFAYRHGFRIPTESQLFRAGATTNSTDLKPVKVDSIEVGFRGNISHRIGFESTLYQMEKKDDIVGIDDESGARRHVNAAETKHVGLELGFDMLLTQEWDLYLSYTRSKHEYVEWAEQDVDDYSGATIPNAPREIANIRLNYQPQFLKGGRVELEWFHQGQHFTSNDNDNTYSGHRLINLRANFKATTQLTIYGRVLNMNNVRYAETTNKWGKLTPGRPREIVMGIKYKFI